MTRIYSLLPFAGKANVRLNLSIITEAKPTFDRNAVLFSINVNQFPIQEKRKKLGAGAISQPLAGRSLETFRLLIVCFVLSSTGSH